MSTKVATGPAVSALSGGLIPAFPLPPAGGSAPTAAAGTEPLEATA